jgi:hypothetical protein
MFKPAVWSASAVWPISRHQSTRCTGTTLSNRTCSTSVSWFWRSWPRSVDSCQSSKYILSHVLQIQKHRLQTCSTFFLLIAIEPNDSGVGALVLSATRMCSWLKFRTIVAAGLQRGWVCLHEKYLSAKFCCVPLRDSFRVCSPFRIKQWFRPSGLGCWSQL